MSVTVQTTRLVPTAYGSLPSLTTLETPQLSLVETGTPSTRLLTVHRLRSELVNTSAGQVIVGRSLSLTITVKEQLVAPLSLEAVQLTLLVPTVNALPDAGVQVTIGSGLPVALGLNVSVAEHSPASLLVVMSEQVMVGL